MYFINTGVLMKVEEQDSKQHIVRLSPNQEQPRIQLFPIVWNITRFKYTKRT